MLADQYCVGCGFVDLQSDPGEGDLIVFVIEAGVEFADFGKLTGAVVSAAQTGAQKQ